MIEKKNPRAAKNAIKENLAKEGIKPLRGKEVIRQIRSGKLTEEQALKLRRRYMDSLEYNGSDSADIGVNR